MTDIKEISDIEIATSMANVALNLAELCFDMITASINVESAHLAHQDRVNLVNEWNDLMAERKRRDANE